MEKINNYISCNNQNSKLLKIFSNRKLGNRTHYFLLLIIIFALSYYISNYWYQFMLIQGDSMNPTYHDLQIVILDRHRKDYTYGDVIAFQCKSLHAVLVKRIAACPGDTIKIEQGTLYVNGVMSEVYFQENLFEYAGNLEEMIQLGTEQYIVIGDNISKSKDSRDDKIGCVRKKDILGSVIGGNIKKEKRNNR